MISIFENRPHVVSMLQHTSTSQFRNFAWTAVNTNIGGTLNVVEYSDKYSVDKFVLVSTDKAVNPVNGMGATRAAEKLIQSYNANSKRHSWQCVWKCIGKFRQIPTFQGKLTMVVH